MQARERVEAGQALMELEAMAMEQAMCGASVAGGGAASVRTILGLDGE